MRYSGFFCDDAIGNALFVVACIVVDSLLFFAVVCDAVFCVDVFCVELLVMICVALNDVVLR